MARFAHIALDTSDLVKTANFYQEAFRMVEMERTFRPGTGEKPSDEILQQIYLSDGNMNLTLIQVPLISFVGMEHVGFVVDSIDETLSQKTATGLPKVARRHHSSTGTGATRVIPGQPPAPKGGHYDVKVIGPEDLPIDVAQTGSEQCWTVPASAEGIDQIRHIGLGTTDVVQTADFFKVVFGLKEARRRQEKSTDEEPSPEMVRKINLTDGHLNIAISRVGFFGFDRIGLHHFGVMPVNMDETMARLEAVGATPMGFGHPRARRRDVPEIGVHHDPGVQMKYRGPDGVIIDLFGRGWAH